MMYQFQRSFIKAASESVDVYGLVPEEEPHFPGAAIPPALLPPPVLPGCVLASRAGLELLGVSRGGGGSTDSAGSTGLAVTVTVTVTISCC